MPGKNQNRTAQSQREEQEQHGRHHHEPIGVSTPHHDGQRARERNDVRQVVRGPY